MLYSAIHRFKIVSRASRNLSFALQCLKVCLQRKEGITRLHPTGAAREPKACRYRYIFDPYAGNLLTQFRTPNSLLLFAFQPEGLGQPNFGTWVKNASAATLRVTVSWKSLTAGNTFSCAKRHEQLLSRRPLGISRCNSDKMSKYHSRQ